MRELGEWNPDRYRVVVQWPLREALLSYSAKLKHDAEKAYRFDVMAYLLQAPWRKKGSKNQAPEVPDILKD